MKYHLLGLLFVLSGCSSTYFQDDRLTQAKMALDGLRQEVADLKHELRSTQVSLQILEEKCEHQDYQMASLKTKNPKFDQLASQLSLLERKLIQGENFQEKVLADLRLVSSNAQQYLTRMQECEKEIAFQKTRLDEVAKLKTTLSSISQVIQQKKNKHVVKTGETLEKIARQNNVTVAALKKANHLNGDRIQVGQQLEIPNE